MPALESKARLLTICEKVQICAARPFRSKRNTKSRSAPTDKIDASANQQEIAANMGMSEHELHEWEQAFQANAHESLADVYDQYSIWYASEEDSPEEKLAMRN